MACFIGNRSGDTGAPTGSTGARGRQAPRTVEFRNPDAVKAAGYRVCPTKAKEAGAKKTFSLNVEMLKCPITPDDVRKLLTEGKTGLKKFVSNRTRRAFEAFLVADKEKGWWFAFPPRKPKAGKEPPTEPKAGGDQPF